MSAKLTATPLDYAVYHIIKNSHLMLDSSQYVHPLRIKDAMEDNMFPIISSSTRQVAFDKSKYFATIFVDLILKVPEELLCGDTAIDAEILSSHTLSYQRDLTEIGEWIMGKRKVNGKKLIDVRLADNLDFPAQIRFYYGLSSTGGAAEANTIKKFLNRGDIFVIQLRMTVYSATDIFCCPANFTPDETAFGF